MDDRMDSRAVLDRRNAGKEEGVPADLEQEYWQALLASPHGRWLIGNLVRKSGVFGPAPRDAYENGRYNLVWKEIVAKIAVHFGYAPFTSLTKGTDNGSGSENP